jgi:Tol biopolymer transport system component/DNA-binding winged helix-turn-helix (wHTH) protein
LYTFGAFVADPVVGRLYHGVDDVPLTPKSFKVLMVLVGSPGQLVDKEELFRQVWPDTFVEPNNLARNVSMIRKALHERDSDQEYIVTLSGRGYRFVAPVSLISRADLAAGPGAGRPAGVPESPAILPIDANGAHPTENVPASEPGRSGGLLAAVWRPSQRFLAVAGLLAAVLVSAGAMLIASLTRPGDPSSQRRLWQLTSTGRLDGEPTWSPDGQSIAYSSDRDGSFKIWTQRISGGSPVQITAGPSRDWQPSWSPDGRHIAFRSERDGSGLFVVPNAGGGARRIAEFGRRPQWSPDGSRILFCEGRDLYTVGLNGAAPSRVAGVVLSSLTDRCRVAWHPDGRRISVYNNDRGRGSQFWTVPLAGGPPVLSRIAPTVDQRLTEAGVRLSGFAWAPRGDALYFEGQSARTQNLWRIRVNPRTLEWIAGPERLTTSSGLESGMALSPDGKRLAFGSRFERTSVWSLPFDPVAGQITGEGEAITPEGANAKILDISPDGSQLVYRVNSRATDELWIRSLDRQADRLRKVEVDADIVHPRWSRDGTQLAYLRRPANRSHAAAVVLLEVNSEMEHQVVLAAQSPEMVYDWGPDGGSLLVRCRGNPVRSAICRLSTSSASSSRPEMHVIASDADRNLYAAAYSPDGRWVSFIAAPDLSRSTVFVSPAAGGPWAGMTDTEDHSFKDLPRWSPDGRTLYFLSNRTGFWNLWGRRFDTDAGAPRGEPFQISRFDSSVRMVGPDVSALQIAVTRERLILPVTQTSGAVWVLDDVD